MDDITASNTLARVSASGSIWFVRELTTKFRCGMELQNYPIGRKHRKQNLLSEKYPVNA